MGGQKPREIAVRLLLERDQQLDYIENLLEKSFARYELSPQDRSFLQELVYGVARWQATLDWLISRKTEGRTQKPGLRALLRLGLYQIFWMTRVAPHAAVHETVELGKQMGFGPQAGFLNAILRAYLREKDAATAALERLKLEQPSIAHSHPQWIVDRWILRWGRQAATQLLEWNNQPPPTYARVNRLKTGPEALVERWATEGVEAIMRTYDWAAPGDVYELTRRPPLAQLPSFQDGLFYVQDPSTLLAANMLDPKPAEVVLDLCAAPGGKTCIIAQRMGDQGTVVAHDADPTRLKLIAENVQRLGIRSVEMAVDLMTVKGRAYDRILLDAPCSNTGVMRRRVDLRWRVQSAEITRLAATQSALLDSMAPLVKENGVIVYSTCSVEPEENSAVVQGFLKRWPAFQREEERELLPFRDGVDGAYVVRLRRLGSS